MKSGVRILGFAIAVIWTIISIPFLITMWFLGGSEVMNNFGEMLNDIFD